MTLGLVPLSAEAPGTSSRELGRVGMPGFVADITVERCQNYLYGHRLTPCGKILPEKIVVVNSFLGGFGNFR